MNPTPIRVPVHKSDFNYSYFRSHFSWLPQAVSKEIINCMSQKIGHTYMKIDGIISGFGPNEVRSYYTIFDHSIATFGIIVLCLGFSNIYYVDSLYRFIKSVVDNFKLDICVLKYIIMKKDNIKTQYAKKFIQNLVLGDPTTCVY